MGDIFGSDDREEERRRDRKGSRRKNLANPVLDKGIDKHGWYRAISK